jgi:hypothetical protein
MPSWVPMAGSDPMAGPSARWHWILGGHLPGCVWFEIDAPAGELSGWPMLFGSRVLARRYRAVSAR